MSLGQMSSDLREDIGAKLCLFTVRCDLVCSASIIYNSDNDYLLLGDIVSEVEDKGYSSTVMKNVILIAKTLGVSGVRGNLSESDQDHFDKLEYFYNKFGFEVKFNGLRTKGKICLKLEKH